MIFLSHTAFIYIIADNEYMCKINTHTYAVLLCALFNCVFMLSTMTHKHSRRQKLAYKIPFCRTNCKHLSLAYIGPKYGTLIF